MTVRAITSGFSKSSTNFTVVLVALVAAGVASFISDRSGLYLPAFAAAMLWYVVISRPTAQPRRTEAETTMVAEQIVAIGVASLIFHVAMAGFDLRAAWTISKKFTGDAIWVAAERFGEGLICATLAPLAAMWVRAVNVDTSENSASEAPLPPSVTAEAAIIADFTAARTIADAATAIAAQADQYNVALQRLVETTDTFCARLQASATATTTSIDVLLNGIDARLISMTAALSELTMDLERRMANLGSTVDTLTKSIGGIAEPISKSFAAVAEEVRVGGRTLQGGLDDAATDVRSAGKIVADDFRIVAAGFAEHGRAISRALDGVPEAVEQRVVAISANVVPLVQRLTTLEAGLAGIEGAAQELAAELPRVFDTSVAGVSALKSEMTSLGAKMNESAILLQGLQDLIAAVRRFIPADADPADAGGRRPQ